MGLLNDLFKMHIRSKLPRLKKTLINPRESQTIEEDAHRMMMAGVARDRFGAEDLLARHELPVADVIRMFTKPRRADWRKRLKNRLRRLEGSYEHDPHAAELRALSRGKRTGTNLWM